MIVTPAMKCRRRHGQGRVAPALSVAFAAALSVLCGPSAPGAPAAPSHGENPETHHAVLKGRVGAKADAVFTRRLTSEKARGDIFDEAVNAFATKMDDLHPYPPGATNHYGWWQGEYWGKTMLSQCAFARYSGRGDVKDFIHGKAVEFVRRFQREDGYLSSYADEDHVFGFNWNVWSRKYTMWALVEAYDLTGDAALLAAAGRMADHLAAQLKRLGVSLADTGFFAGIPSLSILKPAVLLAERTGEKRHWDFARSIVAENDRPDGRCPNIVANAFGDKPVHEWYPNPGSWAKAYEMMSVVEGLVEFHRATGERRPLEAAIRIWEKLRMAESNAIGSVGYHDHFIGASAYPNAICESCDVIHWMRLCRYLNEATGDAKYLDAWELAFLNAFLAGVFRDGEWGTHDVRSHGRRHLQGMYEVGMTYHFCCIDNVPRGFCDWADRQIVCSGDALSVNFYTDCSFSGGGRAVDVDGNYPVNETVRVKVRSDGPLHVRFRVPGWCGGGMAVDGAKVRAGAPYAEVEMERGERLFTLAFDMTPRVEPVRIRPIAGGMRANDAALTFEMRGHNNEMAGFARKKPGVRVVRGPLILAKARRVGDDDKTCFSDIEGLDASWRATAVPVSNAEVWGAWQLTVEKPDGSARRTMGVCDFASAADTDDPRNSFSIWF